MKYVDYYQILGVSRDAEKSDVKKAYRKLARKYHPDVNQAANAEDKFKEVNEAYEVLKDADKRQAYDRFGADWKHGQQFDGGGFGGGFQGGNTSGGGFGGGDFSDFFESIFGGAHQQAGGSPFQQGRQQKRGADLQLKLDISLEEAFNGGSKTIQFARAPGATEMRNSRSLSRRGSAMGRKFVSASRGRRHPMAVSPVICISR